MIEEEENKKKKNKKKEDKEEKDYEDFMDDIEADKDLQKVVPIYKNKDRLKHMTEDELNRQLEDLEIIGLIEEMNINEAEKEEVAINKEEAENIDDLISKMEKVTIEKD